MQETILKLKGICKSFGDVKVLEDIDLTIESGKIYALAGENGAGKSTLCNIMTGALGPTGGELVYEGTSYGKFEIMQAKKEFGIRMVHQELHVLPGLTVAENVFLGDEISDKGFICKKEMNAKTKELLDTVGLDVNPDMRVSKIEVAARQLVEIARGLNGKARLIILDEPTSSLSAAEIRKLFEVMTKLKAQGMSFIFISHRLEEMMEICDSIIVLKDGRKVTELDAGNITQDEIVKFMVGRNYSDYYDRHRTCYGKEIFRVTNLCTEKIMAGNAYTPRNISFSVSEGEVLGIAGLVGAGRTELIRTIFGDLKKESGEIFVDEKKVEIHTSADAMKLNMAWLSEDRKTQGIILNMTIRENLSLAVLKRFVKNRFIQDRKIREFSEEQIRKLKIRTTGPDQKLKNLSGGNQQKVVLGKWLATNPKILFMDEPTRGIDIGAKVEIYKMINELSAQGIGIILVSSELPEVMGMSDRILVMYEGRLAGELTKEEYSEEKIMYYATGRGIHG